jgi:hypothetical protein
VHTDPKIWAKQICEVLSHAYCGGPGFESIFLKAIDHCYSQNGVYSGSKDYPTLQDVKTYLETLKPRGREAQWLQSVMRTINAICFGSMDETVNSKNPVSVTELLGRNVILELDTLSNADKTFLIESVLLYVHHHRLENPPRGRLENVIIIEEAHHLLRGHTGSQETLIETCLREMRSLGIGIIIVDQMPSLISRVAFANTYCTIGLNVKTGQDVSALAQAMLLTTEQKEMLGRLPVGQAIVKIQDRYVKPFHVKVPLMEAGRRKVIHYKPSCPDSAETDRVPPVKEQPDGVSRIPHRINNVQQLKQTPELYLLTDVARYPVSTVVERYKRLGVSPRKGNLAKRYLLREGWIEEQVIQGVNGWVKLLRPTMKGEEQLRKHEIKHRDVLRHGGLKHKYWVQAIADHCWQTLGDGYEVLEEFPLGKGRTADVVVIENGKILTAIEIETGKSDVKANVRKYAATDIAKVIIAFTDQNILGSFEKSLEPPPHVTLTTTKKVINLKAQNLVD